MKVRSLFKDLIYSSQHKSIRRASSALVASVAALAAAAGYWWPANASYHELAAEVEDARRELVQSQHRDELINNFKIASREVPLLEERLRRTPTQAQILENLSRLARQSGIRLLSESYEDAGSEKGKGKLVAVLVIQGSYSAIKDFLDRIATLPFWAEIREISLDGSQGGKVVKGNVRLAFNKPSADVSLQPL